MKKASEADVVVAGLFGRVRSGAKNSVGLPEAGEKVLNEILKGKKPVVSIAFGNPYLLRGFPAMKNYIVAYGDMSSLQSASADAIFGKNRVQRKTADHGRRISARHGFESEKIIRYNY